MLLEFLVFQLYWLSYGGVFGNIFVLCNMVNYWHKLFKQFSTVTITLLGCIKDKQYGLCLCNHALLYVWVFIMHPIMFHEILKQHSMPPYQWNQNQFLRKCFQRLYYYYVLVLCATGGQANISTAYCHGFSSIYAAGKKGIYKIRPRSKERKRVQGGGESSSSIGKGEANANFISSLIHLEYIHWQELEIPRTDAIIINIQLDLQSIGSSPHLQRWLIRARQIQWSELVIWTWDISLTP